MLRFINKHINREKAAPSQPDVKPVATVVKKPAVEAPKNDNKKKNDRAMTDKNFDQMEQLANQLTPEQTTKRIKKDKGLIERVESQKTILTEDNRQLLVD